MTQPLLTKTDLYFILKLDEYRDFLSTLATWSIVVFAVLLVARIVYRIETKQDIKKGLTKYILYLILLPFLFSSIKILLPTKNEMITMHVVPLIANNKYVRRVPNRILKILDSQLGRLDKYLNKEAEKRIKKLIK